MSRFCTRIINYVFYCMLSLYLFVNIVKFSEYIGFGILERILPVIIGASIILFVFLGKVVYEHIRQTHVWGGRSYKLSIQQMYAGLFVIVVLTKIILVIMLNTNVNSTADMPNYLDFATQFAEKGKITDNLFYATRYQYTVVYGWFLSPIVKLFGNDPRVVTTFLSIIYAIITVILFDIVRRYAGNEKTFWGLLIYNMSPVGLFISQVLIHETALLFFYVLSFWFFLFSLKETKTTFWKMSSIMISGVLIAFGTCINKGGLVVIISFLIYAFIFLFKKEFKLKNISYFMFFLFCYFASYYLVSNVTTDFIVNHIEYSSEEEEKYCEHSIEARIPLGWGIYLGSNMDERGQFNDVDFNTYNKYYEIEDIQEAKDYQLELIYKRLQIFSKDPFQIPIHLYYKFKKLYARPFVAIEYCKDNNLYPILGEHLGGYPMIGFRSLGNIYNIILASIILFSYKKKNDYDKYINPDLQFKLFFIGLTLALLPFEIAQKYVCHMQIILTCIGIMSFSSFLENSQKSYDKVFCRILKDRKFLRK